MTTTPTIPNVPQEQLDEEAARQYILLGGSYRRVAKVIHCDPATAFRRAMRWAKCANRKRERTTMDTQHTEQDDKLGTLADACLIGDTYIAPLKSVVGLRILPAWSKLPPGSHAPNGGGIEEVPAKRWIQAVVRVTPENTPHPLVNHHWIGECEAEVAEEVLRNAFRWLRDGLKRGIDVNLRVLCGLPRVD